MLPKAAVAQLYIQGSNYVYNRNQVVYVKKEVELKDATSFFYLRKEGQLLQGAAGTGVNKGLGKLSVFQEGTVNNYAYNYWCSPVGVGEATSGNSLFGITQLGAPTTTVTTTPATTTHNGNYDGTSSPLNIEPYWIWKFSVKNAYADWIHVENATNIAAGEGFTMKGVSGTDATSVDGVTNNSGSNQRYDFRGKPNDGTIDIPVAGDGTDDGAQLTLTGNPYPSAIDLNMFLLDPSNAGKTDGAAYYWESNKSVNSHIIANYIGGYGTYVPISMGSTGIYTPAAFWTFDGSGNYVAPVGGAPPPPGLSYKRRFCPVGQGFMIQGIANGTVQIKNSYRVFVKEGSTADESQFEKKRPGKTPAPAESNFLPAIASVSGYDYTTVSKLPVPQIRFQTTLDKVVVLPMVLAFEPTATDDADFAMDAKSFNENLDQEIYFDINALPYIIDVINFDETKKIPLGFRNTAEANYKIEISEIINFSAAQNIYIHDKDTDEYHDLKRKAFNVKMPAGTNNSRFEITFKTAASLNVIANTKANFYVNQNNITQNLTIDNAKTIDLKEINIYDISGKLIFTKNNLGSDTQYNYSTSGWSDGVYIVNLISTDNQTESKKVIVSNAK